MSDEIDHPETQNVTPRFWTRLPNLIFEKEAFV